MPHDTSLRLSLLPRRLLPFTQLIIVAALVLVVSILILVWPVIWKSTADRSEDAAPTPLDATPGTFKPTKEQWAGFKIEPVRLVSFRPEQVTEGSIAIDDDLTTPVFSPYPGRVIKLIAKLGDHVEPGAPLFEIQVSELVQAQNDLITALATVRDRPRILAKADKGIASLEAQPTQRLAPVELVTAPIGGID
jgi:cobalt-zinc-cadmium efflux system membrane fusion protein